MWNRSGHYLTGIGVEVGLDGTELVHTVVSTVERDF